MHTEDINPRSRLIDALPVDEIINLMNYENLLVMKTINSAKDSKTYPQFWINFNKISVTDYENRE